MDSDAFETSNSKTVPVADLLRRIAQELRDLTQTIDDLQQVLGRLVSNSAVRDSGSVRELQNFDRLGQTMSGIADFVDALGEDAPADWRLNPHPASRVLLLSELAVRLVSQNARAPVPASQEAGEFEFF
jgi:hypothetical protein